jgi:hypothetical protein
MAIFLRGKNKISCAELGLPKEIPIVEFENLEQSLLQGVANSILRFYGKIYSDADKDVEWHYFNGRTVLLPYDLLMSQGHKIVDALVPKLGILQVMFGAEKAIALQKNIPEVIFEHGGWMPKVLDDLFFALVNDPS